MPLRPVTLSSRIAALWLLILHGAGLGWTMPLATAALASVDDDHAVRLQWSSSAARVVLAHDALRPGREVRHDHCPLAGALVAMASPSRAGESDHVLEFGPGSGVSVPVSVPSPVTAPAPPISEIRFPLLPPPGSLPGPFSPARQSRLPDAISVSVVQAVSLRI